ncbi:ABC transporter permease [Vibrio pelagius]|uniref:ABC transporter permease n=1 Tax=Vibrio pelagius TaxID=28169 RepID=UPI0021C393A7|nr:ABC transporter permease [Vibrio pelagius]
MESVTIKSPESEKKFQFSGTYAELYIGLGLCIVIVTAVLLSGYLFPDGGMSIDLRSRLLPPFTSWDHPLGTDPLGRDVLARIVVGGKVSLMVGVFSVLGAMTLGVVIGLIAGYYRGIWDIILMRCGDIQLALPFILIAIVFTATLGASVENIILFMILSQWVGFARIVRSSVLSLREREFVQSAQAVGVSNFTIMWRHILPNSLNAVLILMVLSIGNNILLESSLTFLGLGSDPSIPSWGGMLADGRSYMQSAWWVCVFPGIAIMLTVLGTNLVGDWLRDKTDPTSA